MKTFLLFATTFLTLTLVSCADYSDMGKGQDAAGTAVGPYPGFKGGAFRGEKNFAALLNEFPTGKAEPTPWAGFWWPYVGNGIAAGKFTGGNSPAGKYDAARGRTVSAQYWEVHNHGSLVPKVAGWWGHCNGWSAAAVLFPEPKESVRVNGIEFTVGDIKALLTEMGMETSADFFGDRVDWGNDFNSPKYDDTVPNQFFLVITNYMGRLKQAVLIDRYTTDQVWNQPVAGYRFEYPKPSDYLGADPRAPGVYRINVTATIWWVRDDVAPDAITPEFTFEFNAFFESRQLNMELWVDAPIVFDSTGKIQSSGDLILTRKQDSFVGGAWRMGNGFWADAWPDYMWVPYSIMTPTEYSNPFVHLDWVKDHILVPGGADDTSVTPRPIDPPPPVEPTPSPTGFPDPWPSNNPTPNPPPTGPAPAPEPTFNPPPYPDPFPDDPPAPVPSGRR